MGTTSSRLRNQHGNSKGLQSRLGHDFVETDGLSESDCDCDGFHNMNCGHQWLVENFHVTADSFVTACQSGNLANSFQSSVDACQSGNLVNSFQSSVDFQRSVPCHQNGGTQCVCKKHQLYLCGIDDKVGLSSSAFS